MNFTEHQISLAGGPTQDDNRREFAGALDLQGEGVRVLDSNYTVNDEGGGGGGDCCVDLAACTTANDLLEEELEEQDEILGGTCFFGSTIQDDGTGVCAGVSVLRTAKLCYTGFSGGAYQFAREVTKVQTGGGGNCSRGLSIRIQSDTSGTTFNGDSDGTFSISDAGQVASNWTVSISNDGVFVGLKRVGGIYLGDSGVVDLVPINQYST
jgi:hypothetical protein